MNRARVFIWGSCVSRDTFEYFSPEDFELVAYVARQSAVSAYTRPVSMIDPPRFDSPFQSRMVTADFASSLLNEINATASTIDLLMVDLTDERLGLYLLPDGTVITRSVELIQSGAERDLPVGTTHIPFGTEQHLAYWTRAIEVIGGFISKAMPRTGTVLLDIPWATYTDSGQKSPDSFGISAAAANRLMRPYVQAAEEALGALVITLPSDAVRSSPNHPWGDAPFHYAEDVYLGIVRQLTGQEGRRPRTASTEAPSPPHAPAEGARPSLQTANRTGSPGSEPRQDGVDRSWVTSGPNLFLPGTQRAGVRWLARQLRKHPEICIPEKLELNFFNRAASVGSQDEADRYLSEFSGETARWRGDATSHYFWHAIDGPFSTPKFDAAEAIAERVDSGARTIVSLRDPVSRAISAYWQHFSAGRIDGSTGIFRSAPTHGIVDLGFYKRHHQHWAQVLGEDSVTVLLYDDLIEDPRSYLSSALAALNLEASDDYWNSVSVRDRKEASPSWMGPFLSRHPIDRQEVAGLLSLYEPDIRYVESLLGRDLPEWRDFDYLVEINIGA